MAQTEDINEGRAPWMQRVATYLPSFLVLGVAVPALVYVLVMALLGWRVPVIGSNAVVTYGEADGPVYLYVSRATNDYIAGVGGNYKVLVDPWRTYFAGRKLPLREINDLSSLSGRAVGSVLILPSTVAISETERSRIQAFRSQGGGVLATWSAGTRSAAGDWVGWSFLEQLGARVIGEMAPDNEERQLVFSGQSPLSYTHPAGQRIWMSKSAEPLLRLRGEMVAGRFTNWARVVDADRRQEGAILYSEGSPSTGRSVVFGFAETTWESHPAAMYPLIDDVLQWLRREPAIVRASWPEGKRAASVIEMDSEEGFVNTLRFSEQLKTANVPATFFLLTSVARQFPDVVTELAKHHEIAYHGDVHVPFKAQPEATQERRLQTMVTDMRALLPNAKNIVGFRAPEESYDATTERLLVKLGLRYHAADPNRSEGRLPFVARMEDVKPEDSLIVLPRTQRDDMNFASANMSSEQIAAALNDDFDMASDTGSLGWLSIHTQRYAEGSPLAQVIPAHLEYMKKQGANVWLASAGQVASWWRERERFRISTVNAGPRVDLNVTVGRGEPIARVNAIVMLPYKNAVPIIRSTKVGGAEPTATRLDAYRSSIKFPPLAPGDYSYRVTFETK